MQRNRPTLVSDVAKTDASLRSSKPDYRALHDLAGWEGDEVPVASADGEQDPGSAMGEVGEPCGDPFYLLKIEFEPSVGPLLAPVVCHARIGVRHCFNVRPRPLISGIGEARASSMIESIHIAASSGSPHSV